MRTFVILCSLALIESGRPAGESCWFLGMRVARVPSECKAGTCSSIAFTSDRTAIHPSSELSPTGRLDVSCDDARKIVDTIVGLSEPTRPDTDIDIINRALSGSFLSSLRRLTFEGVPFTELDIGAMRMMDSILMQTAAVWDEWPQVSARRLRIISTPEVQELKALVHILSYRLSMLNDRFNAAIGSFAQAIHFLYDFLAVVGKWGFAVPRSERIYASLVARTFPIAYRPFHTFQSVSPIPLVHGIPTDGEGIISLAKTIEYMGTMTALPKSRKVHLIQLVTSLEALIPLFPITGTEALLGHLVISDMCGKYRLILTDTNVIYSGVASKLLHTLTKFCGHVVTLRTAMEINRNMHLRLYDGSVGIPHAVAMNLTDFEPTALLLEKDHLPWHNGLHLIYSGDVRALAARVLIRYLRVTRPVLSLGHDSVIFKPRYMYVLRQVFENQMRAIGRGIGLCLIAGARVPYIGLRPDVIDAIQQQAVDDPQPLLEMLTPIARPGEPHQIITDFVLEPAWYVAMGIRDILGPLGPNLRPLRSWRSVFETL